jgi:hypothetical protein
MKTRIALATGMLLTVGTAVAGTLIYGQGKQAASPELAPSVAISATDAVTPETFAMWQATASSDDYIAPKVPI